MEPLVAIAAVLGVGFLILAGAGLISSSGTGGGDSASLPPGILNFWGPMNQLTAQDIALLAKRAGFVASDIATAVAVALAESGGNPHAYNPETAAGTPEGMGSYGLWQIYRKVHPEFASYDLLDPAQNAAAAYLVYQAAHYSFSPWSTFNNERYVAFLQVANDAVTAV